MKAIRTAKGYKSQLALADAMGVDQATVQRMEALAPSVTLRMFHQAAAFLGVTIADLVSDDRSAMEAALVQAFRHLPAAQQAKWVELLRSASGAAPEDQ